MLVLVMAGNLMAQKTKIKGETKAVSADSMRAAMGKAAMRGSALMRGSRDSLNAANMQPPSAVVDSFAVAPKTDPAYTAVKASQFSDARKRIADAEAELAKAAKALAEASQSGEIKDAELESAAERIRLQTENLDKIRKRLAAVEKEWKASHHPVEPGSVESKAKVPAVPPAPKTASPKGGMTKPGLVPAATDSIAAPKPNPKKLK